MFITIIEITYGSDNLKECLILLFYIDDGLVKKPSLYLVNVFSNAKISFAYKCCIFFNYPWQLINIENIQEKILVENPTLCNLSLISFSVKWFEYIQTVSPYSNVRIVPVRILNYL